MYRMSHHKALVLFSTATCLTVVGVLLIGKHWSVSHTQLTEQELKQCLGGVVYCCDPNLHCSCRQEICSGVTCQPCISQRNQKYICRGHRKNLQGVEECIKTDTPGSACDLQRFWLESFCTVDVWQGDACKGDPAREDYPWMANDCM